MRNHTFRLLKTTLAALFLGSYALPTVAQELSQRQYDIVINIIQASGLFISSGELMVFNCQHTVDRQALNALAFAYSLEVDKIFAGTEPYTSAVRRGLAMNTSMSISVSFSKGLTAYCGLIWDDYGSSGEKIPHLLQR